MSEWNPSSTIRAVRGFVLLAILLLVPTAAYFQKQHFETQLQPGLRAAVLEVLEEKGVEAPAVEINYLDAVIRGRVSDDGERHAVAAAVDALPGVRVTEAGNLLRHLGWIRLERADGQFRAEGRMPRDEDLPLPAQFALQAGWDDALERTTTVESPPELESWAPFLVFYFTEPGNRSVELRQEGLTMAGDATAGMRDDWTARASDVVGKDRVADRFTLRASRYHFPGYQPLSLTAGKRLEQLREDLGGVRIHFANEAEASGGVPESEREKVSRLANAILGAGDEVRYVVGGHPNKDGNVSANGRLARLRAEAVVKMLEEHGVSRAQLEVVAFGVTPDGENDDQVEVLVR